MSATVMRRRLPATRKRRRLYAVIAGMMMLGIATALVLSAFGDNIVFFYGPSDLVEKGVKPGESIRLGGLVEEGSVKKIENGITTEFKITDLKRAVTVRFTGLLPDLFREGQGIVTEGTLGPDGVFMATNVLAKHDENFMPPEVADALKRAGKWNEGDSKTEVSQ